MTDSDYVISEMAKLLGIDSGAISREAPLFSLASSSFRVVELVIELQEEFGVLFRQEDMNGVATVGDLVDLVVDRRRESIGA